VCLEERSAAPRSDVPDLVRVTEIVCDTDGVLWWECREAGSVWSLQRRVGERRSYGLSWRNAQGPARTEVQVPPGAEFLDPATVERRMRTSQAVEWVVPVIGDDGLSWSRNTAASSAADAHMWRITCADGRRTGEAVRDGEGVWLSESGRIDQVTYHRRAVSPGQEVAAVWRPAFRHQGTGPLFRLEERYRLDPRLAAVVPDDPWQQRANDQVAIREEDRGAAPAAGAHLGDGPGLSLDRQDLVVWARTTGSAGCCASTSERMQALTGAVQARLRPGGCFAVLSAAEAFDRGIGDCTEAANLLCAALRAAGIPARVVVGLAYRPAVNAWEGHAWCMAYDGTQARWMHLDATGVVRRRTHAIALLHLDDGLTAEDRRPWDLLGALGSGTISCLPPSPEAAPAVVADAAATAMAQRIGTVLDTALPLHRRRQALTELADKGGEPALALLRRLAADPTEDQALRTLAQERLRRAATSGQPASPVPVRTP
jgi:hypothetical protein